MSEIANDSFADMTFRLASRFYHFEYRSNDLS